MAKIGAPTKYCKEIVEKAHEYERAWKDLGDPVPMLVGLYVHCGINRHTGAQWRKRDDRSEFAAVCARVEVMQEHELLRKGLMRVTEQSITKLMLMRHGYSDRQAIDHTTNGEAIGAAGASKEDLASAKADILAKLQAK